MSWMSGGGPLDAGIYLWDESGFTRVATLTRGQLNDYAANEWWAPANTYLEPDTEYYFLLDCTAGCANDNVCPVPRHLQH